MKHLEQLFENQFDCYADMNDESVVLAMTKEQFVKVVQKEIHKALEEAAEKARDLKAETAEYSDWVKGYNHSNDIVQIAILSLKEKY